MTQRVYWSWHKIAVEGVALDPRMGATARHAFVTFSVTEKQYGPGTSTDFATFAILVQILILLNTGAYPRIGIVS